MTSPRLALLEDYAAEGWPSMDLCSEMLLAHLPESVAGERVCPPFRRVASRVPVARRRREAFNADRLLNRFVLLPLHAQRVANRFDCFHVVDHSYAHLVHALPPERTGVCCHDLDAFRCLLEPAAHVRPRWFRALARHVLNGMQKAAVVFHSSAHAGAELARSGLIDARKLVHAPLGVAAEFTAEPDGPDPAWMQALGDRPWIVHVGQCIPRKRLDVLLDVVAEVRTRRPELTLVKVGGEWSAQHRERIAAHALSDAIVHVHGLSRTELAAVYRRAAVVLMPSESEGFGLPVVEALACGALVVASDIAPLREGGGPAALYAPAGDVASWAETVVRLLDDPAAAPDRAERLAWAARFSWPAHAEIIGRAYRTLAA